MRRLLLLLLLLLAVLILVPFVYAQICGDGDLNPGEECDLPGQDAACPGYCEIPSCVCTKEAQEVLLDLYSGHNLLFSKTQDLAHISKDQAFQDELKVIQYGLRQAFLIPPNNLSCNVVPAMFMLTASYSPYGKENEIDQYNNFLLFKLNDTDLRSSLQVSDTQFVESTLIQNIADQSLVDMNFAVSGSAKCCAYNQLIEPSVLSFTVGNRTCNVQPICGNGIIEFPEQCDDGNNVSGDGCSERCINETCGDSIIQPLLGEFCDPPDYVTCDAGCDFLNATCPNATVDPGEECDPDGALPLNDSSCPFSVNGSQVCGITCHCEYCGNGVIDPFEDCDDGGLCGDNNASCTLLNKTNCANTTNATCILINGDGCSANCTNEYCGDGVIQAGAPRFEQCDPPNNTTCDEACQDPWCGDNITQTWEECDPPGIYPNCDSGVCGDECACQSCGNGILEGDEVCEVDIPCAGNFSCTSTCQCHMCGDGNPEPGEQCGEPGLSCPAGQTCSNCLCSGGGTHTGGGGNPSVQSPAGCCRAFDYLAGSLAAEYYCCGGQDMVGPTGDHINCCAEPELPQCRPYCTLMSCSPPYALDLVTQKCVLTSTTVETAALPEPQKPTKQVCTPGYVMKDEKCVAEETSRPAVQEVVAAALKNGSVLNVAASILVFVAIALVAYMIVARKHVKKIELPRFAPIKNVDNLEKMKTELDDLEKSYDKLEKVIKSMKGGKV